MEYSIGDFSRLVGLSIYTLRFYETEGLIIPVRQGNGRRIYSEEDVVWIQFIKRLKKTKMPIKEIQKYATFRSQGDKTLVNRMDMLGEHRIHLEKEIESLREHLEALDVKIENYREQIKKQTRKPRP